MKRRSSIHIQSENWSRPTRAPSSSRRDLPDRHQPARSWATSGRTSRGDRQARHLAGYVGPLGQSPISSTPRTGSARCMTASSTAPGRRRPTTRTTRSTRCCAGPRAWWSRPSARRCTRRRRAKIDGRLPRHLGLQLDAVRRASTAAQGPSLLHRRPGRGIPLAAARRLTCSRFVLRRGAARPAFAARAAGGHLPADPDRAVRPGRGAGGRNATPEQIARPARAIRPGPADLRSSSSSTSRRWCGWISAKAPFSGRPVALDIAQRLPATLELDLLPRWHLGAWLGVPLGVVAALNHNRWPDYPVARRSRCWASPSPPSGWRSCCNSFSPWNSAGCRCAATDVGALAPPGPYRLAAAGQPAARPLGYLRRRAAASRAAGGHPVARRPGDHRPLHAGRHAGHAAEGFRALRAAPSAIAAAAAGLGLHPAQFGRRHGDPDRPAVRRPDRRRAWWSRRSSTGRASAATRCRRS